MLFRLLKQYNYRLGIRRFLLATFVLLSGTSSIAMSASCSHEFFRPYYKTRYEFCRAGELITDFYTGEKILCEDAEVDHVVSLREAYLGGVCGDDLKQLAKDPENLKLTHWTNNRRKGAMTVEDFLSKEQLGSDIKPRQIANKIRERYGVLSEDDAFANHSARYLSRSNRAAKIFPIAAIRKLKGVSERQVGKRILIFSGTRLIGYTAGVGLVYESVSLIPEGFVALGRSVSTDEEVKRADYIVELLK